MPDQAPARWPAWRAVNPDGLPGLHICKQTVHCPSPDSLAASSCCQTRFVEISAPALLAQLGSVAVLPASGGNFHSDSWWQTQCLEAGDRQRSRQWEGGRFLVRGHTGSSGIPASSATSPAVSWPVLQGPGTQDRRAPSLGELVSSWGEEIYVNTAHARKQAEDIGGGAGGREVTREGLAVGEATL